MSLWNKLVHRFLTPSIRMRGDQFAALKGRARADVVFLGDSITEGGLWSEWFPQLPLRNRGIGGDTTAGVLRRLDSAIDGDPRALFLLIGTNDVGLGIAVDEAVTNVDLILAAIRRRTPGTRVFLQSVMPRDRRLASRVRTLNRRYRDLAMRHQATWVDLWPALEGSPGELRSEFSLDRLHLNGAGYRAWVHVLTPHIERLQSEVR